MTHRTFFQRDRKLLQRLSIWSAALRHALSPTSRSRLFFTFQISFKCCRGAADWGSQLNRLSQSKLLPSSRVSIPEATLSRPLNAYASCRARTQLPPPKNPWWNRCSDYSQVQCIAFPVYLRSSLSVSGLARWSQVLADSQGQLLQRLRCFTASFAARFDQFFWSKQKNSDSNRAVVGTRPTGRKQVDTTPAL